MTNCIFCTQKMKRIYESELLYAIYDKYPVSKGHVLIIPKKHIRTFFESDAVLREEINQAIFEIKKILDTNFNPDGYNIGINNEKAAGQTIFHLHIHLIPRYLGDMEDPTGGVRGVIPQRQKY